MHLLDRSCVSVRIFLKLHATFPNTKIFFPSSDSQVSRSILTGQPNHAEIDMASPKRLYTWCIFFTLHVIYIVHWAHVVTWNTISFSYCMTSSEVTGNLAICDGLSWTPSLFISARLSCAFVDGPGSWASMAVPGSKVIEVAQKHFLSVGFSLLKPAY